MGCITFFQFYIVSQYKNSIRVAGSRTVARPEFREIAPFSFYDYEANYGVNGNVDLKRTSILNGDIRYEFYPKGGEAITIGGFTNTLMTLLNYVLILPVYSTEETTATVMWTMLIHLVLNLK